MAKLISGLTSTYSNFVDSFFLLADDKRDDVDKVTKLLINQEFVHKQRKNEKAAINALIKTNQSNNRSEGRKDNKEMAYLSQFPITDWSLFLVLSAGLAGVRPAAACCFRRVL